MVAHYTMRTYGVNQVFRFVEGIWFKSDFLSENTYFTSYVLPPYVSTMLIPFISTKNHLS